MDKKLSYKFQPVDTRDYKLSVTRSTKTHDFNHIISIFEKGQTTTSVNRIAIPPVYTIPNLGNILDQGNIGDCVANAFSYSINSITKNSINVSRLCLYAFCRILDNTPLSRDDGTYVRTCGNALIQYGKTSEVNYPHNTTLVNKLPPLNVLNSLTSFSSFTYIGVKQDILSIKTCLNNNNTPIIFGFLVYSSFNNTGIIPTPNPNKERLLGGHCMVITGYNDTLKLFTCANSWGTAWGNKGYCTIPYAYLLNPNLASDFCYLNLKL